MFDQITLSLQSVAKLCPECKATLVQVLGLAQDPPAPQVTTEAEAESWGHAELGLQAARAFLLGCNSKTKQALTFIVESGETFSIHALENQMEVERGSLRALWGGLTKRTRTITGDPDAWLIQWGDELESGDFIGQLNPVTHNSFKRALAE